MCELRIQHPIPAVRAPGGFSVGRPFDFSESTIREARLRQYGRCAACNELLEDLYEHAHHVVPQQAGSPKRFSDQWLKTSDNCVILCDDCHTAYHGHGRFRDITADPAVFRYSHGNDGAAHNAWLTRVAPRFHSMAHH
jgi:hypothetical protein